MTNVLSSSSSALAVNEEIILEQFSAHVEDTRLECTLSQRLHGDSSSFSSRSDGSSACVNPHVEEYLRQSYEQNLQMYESHRMMQQLLTQLHPNIQFPTINDPVSYVHPGHPTSPGPLPPPDSGEDDASDTTNLRD